MHSVFSKALILALVTMASLTIADQPEVTLLKITVQPGVELPWHTHPVINVGYMLKGTLTVITKSGQTKTLHAGDALVEVVGPVHKGINNGSAC